MEIDLSRFRVVYEDRVFRAIALMDVQFGDDGTSHCEKIVDTPKILEIIVINQDGNIETIRDEAWMFQFLPVTTNEGAQ